MSNGREKVIYAVQTLIMFLGVAKEGPDGNTLKFKEQAVDLLAALSTDAIDSETAIEQLNFLIARLNEVLKAPYPAFKNDSDENLVKNEIVAFEHYLNQELKVNHLTVQQEAPLFNDSLKLWESIGNSVSVQEGVSKFKTLIDKLNAYLPENEHYPAPDPDHFENL